MLELSREAEGFLYFIGDHAVGGAYVTPACSHYANLKQTRTGLRTPLDWMTHEAIHINAAGTSLSTALSSLCLPETHQIPVDRVILMDFDQFEKDGKPKPGTTPVTPDDIIALCKRRRKPLPYCWVPSGTEGNFHMIWVLDTPIPRASDMRALRELYKQWGADERYTNSTMRNPVFYDGMGKTHWYTEWSDKVEKVYNLKEMYLAPVKEDLLVRVPFVCESKKKQSLSKRAKANQEQGRTKVRAERTFRHKMTEAQLDKAMLGAVDGNGRWLMARGKVCREIMRRYRDGRGAMTMDEVREIMDWCNNRFAEPLTEYQVNKAVKWWTPGRQLRHFEKQTNAGKSWYAQATHRKSVMKYWPVKDMVDLLLAHLQDPEANPLPKKLMALDKGFKGKRKAPRGVTYAWVAHMLEYGEVTFVNQKGDTETISGVERVKRIMKIGLMQGYERAEYERFLAEDRDKELTEPTQVRYPTSNEAGKEPAPQKEGGTDVQDLYSPNGTALAQPVSGKAEGSGPDIGPPAQGPPSKGVRSSALHAFRC